MVEVRQGAFDFTRIYKEAVGASAGRRENAGAPYVAVSYYTPGQNSAREYYLLNGRETVADLFLVARDNVLPPSNEFEERWHDKVEGFWRKSPFVSPGNQDAPALP
ncbi:MAG: hypothetical protein V3W31_09725 [Thermodesulfobacteriota bacterium]